MGDGDFESKPPGPPAPNITNNNGTSPSSLSKALNQQKNTINAAQQQLTKWFQNTSSKTLTVNNQPPTSTNITLTNSTNSTNNMNNDIIEQQTNQQETLINTTTTELDTVMLSLDNTSNDILQLNHALTNINHDDEIITKYADKLDNMSTEFIKTKNLVNM
jgi:hypothetical protein